MILTAFKPVEPSHSLTKDNTEKKNHVVMKFAMQQSRTYHLALHLKTHHINYYFVNSIT